jgi:hypothetical protein
LGPVRVPDARVDPLVECDPPARERPWYRMPQSLPTANTSDVDPVVVSFTLGAPVAPDPAATAPTPLTPSMATTVRSWLYPDLDGVEVTVALGRMPEAVAFHTSLSPDCPFSRFTSVHVSPAPVTVAVCRPDPAGPSEATNASSCSPAIAVWNGGVVTVPLPCTLS